MTLRAGAVGAALLLAAAGLPPAHAQDAAAAPDAGALKTAARGGRAAVSVEVSRVAGAYEVTGRALTSASRPAAWSVLTDYDGIEGFVSSMRESRVSERADTHLLVEQTAIGRVLLFSRTMRVVLFVHEVPESSVIRFEDVLGKDFDAYRGEWRIEDRGAHREIHYRVQARPSFGVPDLVARGMFRRTVRDLLAEVEAEMSRRASAIGARAH